MHNPLTNRPVSNGNVRRNLEQLFEARANAKKPARSGHPGRRAEARRALSIIRVEVKRQYLAEV
jgi:hypothetical protein